jgi:hypothetical protein
MAGAHGLLAYLAVKLRPCKSERKSEKAREGLMRNGLMIREGTEFWSLLLVARPLLSGMGSKFVEAKRVELSLGKYVQDMLSTS